MRGKDEVDKRRGEGEEKEMQGDKWKKQQRTGKRREAR